MLLAGDEVGRSQRGNNNAYCQDNEISWIDWNGADRDLLAFTKKLIHLRRNHPTFKRRRWFMGRPLHGRGAEDIAWFLPDGSDMSEEHWGQDFAKSLIVYLNGLGIRTPDDRGARIVDDHFMILFNAHEEGIPFTLPGEKYGTGWKKILDTAADDAPEEVFEANAELHVSGRSLVLLSQKVNHP